MFVKNVFLLAQLFQKPISWEPNSCQIAQLSNSWLQIVKIVGSKWPSTQKHVLFLKFSFLRFVSYLVTCYTFILSRRPVTISSTSCLLTMPLDVVADRIDQINAIATKWTPSRQNERHRDKIDGFPAGVHSIFHRVECSTILDWWEKKCHSAKIYKIIRDKRRL